jgi:hypothetical protein
MIKIAQIHQPANCENQQRFAQLLSAACSYFIEKRVLLDQVYMAYANIHISIPNTAWSPRESRTHSFLGQPRSPVMSLRSSRIETFS